MLLALLLVAAEPVQLSIKDVVERVDKFDPLARARAFDAIRAEIVLRRAQWNRISGSVGLSAGYGATYAGFAPVPAPSGTTTVLFDRFTANLNAQLSYPIYAGGAIEGAVDAARARADVAKLDHKAQLRDLKRAALVAYASVLAATQQLEISSRSFERSSGLVDIAQKRKNAGLTTEADVARARLTALRQAEDVEIKKGDRAVALAGLRATLLFAQDVEVTPVDSLEQVALVAGARQADDGNDRYELLNLRLQVLAADADRKVAFAGWLPRLELYLVASYGNGSPLTIGGTVLGFGGADQRFGQFSGLVQGGIRLNWTIWDFFITRDQVAQAEAARDSLEAQRADTERRMAREKEEARARLAQADRRVTALAGGKEVAESAVKLARIRYETGNAVLTEVIDAELESINLQARQVQAAYDRASAYLDKLRAEGQDL